LQGVLIIQQHFRPFEFKDPVADGVYFIGDDVINRSTVIILDADFSTEGFAVVP